MNDTVNDLITLGFDVIRTGEAYIVKSNHSGAVIKREASETDLITFLKGIQYIIKQQGTVVYYRPAFQVK